MLQYFFWKRKENYGIGFDTICRKNYKKVEKDAIILYIKIMVRVNKKGGKKWI